MALIYSWFSSWMGKKEWKENKSSSIQEVNSLSYEFYMARSIISNTYHLWKQDLNYQLWCTKPFMHYKIFFSLGVLLLP